MGIELNHTIIRRTTNGDRPTSSPKSSPSANRGAILKARYRHCKRRTPSTRQRE